MKVIIEGQLIAQFKKPDFIDKETGVATPGKHVLQLLVDTELSNGSIKREMQDVSIPDDQFEKYKAQVGKSVQVKCRFMSKSQVSFFV